MFETTIAVSRPKMALAFADLLNQEAK